MNAQDITARLRERYPVADGWITMTEVTPPKCIRRFDLLAVMGWGSRGHEAMGFEVKVTRADWLRELNAPAKAEPLVNLCSRYWIVAPPNVVKVDEMPATWGLLVVHEGQFRTGKQAPRLEVEPWSDAVWRCMLLRCATRERHKPDDVEKARGEGWQKGWQAGLDSQGESAKSWEKSWREARDIITKAEAATGISLNQWTDFPALGEAMNIIRDQGRGRLAERLTEHAETLRYAADAMVKAAASIRPETVKESA